MKTNLKIFDEIIKNLDNINSLSFESYKNYSLKFPVNYESGNPYNGFKPKMGQDVHFVK